MIDESQQLINVAKSKYVQDCCVSPSDEVTMA